MKTLLSLTAAMILLAPTSSKATVLYGLTTSNQLISFDTASPGSIFTIGTISVPGIIDIDYYPANQSIYGINASGSAFRLSLIDASAILAVTPLSSLGTVKNMDFNPVADRMRIFSTGDQNYRMVPDFTTAPSASGTSGTVIVDGTFTDTTVDLVSSAYTNNFDGAASTTLYSIDTSTDNLIIHSVAPQFNTVTRVGANGALGVNVGSNVGFDITETGTPYVSDGNDLYTINLASGVLISAGTVGGTGLTSIAVPEPSSAVLLLSGLALCLRRRAIRTNDRSI